MEASPGSDHRELDQMARQVATHDSGPAEQADENPPSSSPPLAETAGPGVTPRPVEETPHQRARRTGDRKSAQASSELDPAPKHNGSSRWRWV